MSETTAIPARAGRAVDRFSTTKALLTLSLSMLSLTDGVATAAFINRHGIEMEDNPLMQWIVMNYGFGGMFGFKLVTLAFFTFFHQKMHRGILAALNAIYLYIVCLGVIMARG